MTAQAWFKRTLVNEDLSVSLLEHATELEDDACKNLKKTGHDLSASKLVSGR